MMRIVPASSVQYLRDTVTDSDRFPNPWDASNEQLESVLYCAEIWSNCDKVTHCNSDELVIVTFSEISESFDLWDQSDLADDEKYADVHDYLRDCIDHGFHPVKMKGEC